MAKTKAKRSGVTAKRHEARVKKNLAHQADVQSLAGLKRATGRDAKSKRLVRRINQRVAEAEKKAAEGEKYVAPVKPSHPPAPEVTFYLSTFTTMVKREVNDVRDEKTGKIDTITTRKVFLREIVPVKRKVGGKLVVVGERVTPWVYFPGARAWLGTPDGMFLRVTATIAAWRQAGLLDGLIVRDFPKELHRGQHASPGATALKEAA